MEQESDVKPKPELENPALKCPKCASNTIAITNDSFWCPVCDGHNATDEA